VTITVDSTFSLTTPALPDLQSTERMIGSSSILEVRGRVAAVAGESIEIEGMTAPLGSICQVRSCDGVRTRGRVIGFHGVRPVLAPLERLGALSAGDPVRLLDVSLRLRVGPSLCGRVIDAFGQPLDGKPLPQNLVTVDADRNPPESLDRPPIDMPLETGVQAIDAMLTCGQGQRLGIFAGSGVGKSTLLGMLARGSSADRIVIGLVGERGREVKEFLHHCLGEAGFARSVVVVATSDRPAAQRVAAAWTATAIAEAYRDEGHNVLLLLDSVTRFAMAQRELGLAAGEPPTTRGYPPSVFNMLPRLVERSGRTSKGSITAFYTVLVEGDDNNEPVADTLRGLLDGHIMLSRALAEESHWPPIDVLQSLSRLQPQLISRETAQSVAAARQHLSEYRRHADLIAIGAYRPGSDPRIDAAIAMRDPLRQFLIQDSQQITKLLDSQKSLSRLVQSVPSAPTQPPTNQPPTNQPTSPAMTGNPVNRP
jgi:flagellum-specific ATP synthase